MPIPDSEFQALRKRAAELMLEDRLPSTISKTLFAGYGDGSACSLCGKPVTPKQIEYELADHTFKRDGIRLHLWCHAAWEMEFASTIGGGQTSGEE